MDGALANVAQQIRRTTLILSGLVVAACGGSGSDGGDAPAGGASGARTPIADLTGAWDVTESGVSNCPDLATYTVPPFRIDIVQRGNDLTVVAPAGTFSGRIDGDSAAWGGSYPSGAGTTTITSMALAVASHGDAFSGSAGWRWSDGTTTCSGTSQSINANRVPSAGQPPAAPSALSGSPLSFSSVGLVWNDNAANELGFKLERRAGGGAFAQIALLNADTTNYTDTGLNVLTAYEYRVRAYNGAGDSAYSNVFVVTTLTAPVAAPLAPSGLVLTLNSADSITLHWTDNSANETSFRVERSDNNDSAFSEIASVDDNVTSYTNTGLAPGTRYYYRVRARNATGNSAYSNTANASTPPAAVAPAAPSGLSAAASLLSIRIDLRWSDNSTNETGFKIERSTSANSGFTQIATTAAGVTSYSDSSGLQSSRRYYYRVRATNATAGLDSAYSNTANARTRSGSGGGDDDDDDD